ncbi:ubiquitin activating enzyme (E1) subunit Aos1, putative [Hepatocystis sp. ex Piliocolobus tephrosceles]|nr:ubiquitin activating enzyme (E1) subunit Aos1, putative [Hepatocystis sp. ex Piliocolobus tephrosceles]
MEVINESEKNKIFDRQLRLWGVKAQNRMMNANVLIAGLSGINIEICKNLILNGINITIIDDNIVDEELVENVFFLNKKDLDKFVCIPIFKELKSINQLINIKAYIGRIDIENGSIIIDEELVYNENKTNDNTTKNDNTNTSIILSEKRNLCYKIDDYISNYTCVCISCEEHPLYKLTNINDQCHNKNIGCFATMCNGKFAFLFSDFGQYIMEESYYKTKEKEKTEPIKHKQLNDSTNHTGQNSNNINNNINTTAETFKIEYSPLSHVLNVPFEKFDKKTNQIIFYLFALILFEQDKKFEKKNKIINEQDFIQFCQNFSLLKNEQYLKEVSKMYKINFCLSSSIMGGVTSQEIRKFVSKQHESIPNFCVFDMNQNIVCTSMIT